MFFLGILAFLQITCLPGILLIKAFKIKGGFIQLVVSAFGISLMANYIIVLTLTALGIYLQPVLLVLLVLECGYLAWLFKDELLTPLEQGIPAAWSGLVGHINHLLPGQRQEEQAAYTVLLRAFTAGMGLWALSVLIWGIRVFIGNLGTVFSAWDAVVSWNRWATIWAQNQFPTGTWHYPQLLPANLSVTYVFMNNNQIQLFAKAMVPLFMLAILLILFDLGLSWKNAGTFIAVVLAQLIYKKFVGDYLAEGYADIPVSFFALLSVYTLLKAKQPLAPASELHQAVFLGAIFAAGSAVTKQAGLYLLGLYPLLAYFILLKDPPQMDKRQKIRLLLISMAAALILTAPWYIYKQIGIWQAKDASEVAYLTETVYHGQTILERFSHAAQSLGKYALLLAFLIPALFLLDSALRWVVLLVVLPFAAIWMIYFSYDTRNLALIFPLWALAAGMALGRLVELSLGLASRLNVLRLRAYWVGLLVLAGLLVLPAIFSTNRLQQIQVNQQKQIFNSGLNAKLYDYISQVKPGIKILTNYPIAFLPGLENNQVNYWYTDFASFDQLRSQPDINYLLIPDNADPAILADVEKNLNSGNYRLIFKDKGPRHYQFIWMKKKSQ
jgi:hypothetical protein